MMKHVIRRQPSAGLIYIFCDEQRFENARTVSFVTGHIAVPQDAWNSLPEERRLLVQPSKVPRPERIQKILHELDGVAVITGAKYLENIYRQESEIAQLTFQLWRGQIPFGALQWRTVL